MRLGRYRFSLFARPIIPPHLLPPFALAAVAALCMAGPAGAGDSIARVNGAPGHLLTADAPVGAPVRHTLVRQGLAAGGLVVGIDRETGMLVMPEPDALARWVASRESAVRRARPAPVRHADGTMSLDVRGWMREYATVSIGADGRPRLKCVTGREAVDRARGQAPAPALEER
jgi:hypothetical protein